ncbi:MAG: 2,3-bisphosphoglycerate-independent phosphoglycerate mutase [Rhodospirillales bacterium]|nr:2,3-bisphosphoglycerate-independent phosphoglycerate mutase [Rhodospirillales bacterium]
MTKPPECARRRPRPVMLVILDGWGCREEAADNAVRQARKPAFDRLRALAPHAFLRTSGRDVGLPDGQMGNSEVGHLNIGAGRVVTQELPRIDEAIAAGTLKRAPALTALFAALHRSGGACHLMGLVSPGGVHSHQNHALALSRLLAGEKIATRLHLFLDGRDTPPMAAATDLPPFLASLPDSIAPASLSGRYFAMDRDRRWERVEKAYLTIAEARAPRWPDALTALASAHAAGTGDEFVPPGVIGAYAGIRDGDGLVCFNFRADRVREILAALLDPAFSGFARPRPLHFAASCGMTEYSAELAPFLSAVFPPVPLASLLGEVVAAAGRTQLRMAETEKYAHVTYFLNGGREAPFPGEDRILVPSPKVATYDLQPEMSAPELTEKALAAIESGRYDLIVLNYANPDMVGHTGKLSAAVRAVEAVDQGLGRITAALERAGGALLVTADHGNCELMRDPLTGGPHTAHTTNPVPVLLAGAGVKGLCSGRLADIAPTLLALLGLPQPPEMTGRSLLGDAEPARG